MGRWWGMRGKCICCGGQSTEREHFSSIFEQDVFDDVDVCVLDRQVRSTIISSRPRPRLCSCLTWPSLPDPRVTLDSISRTMHHFYDLWADVKYREALFAQTHLLHQPSSHISGRVQITSLQRCIELMNATMVLLDFVSGLFEPSLVMRNSQDVFTFRTAGAGLLLTQVGLGVKLGEIDTDEGFG